MAVARVIIWLIICGTAMPAIADSPKAPGDASERVKWSPFRPSAQPAAQSNNDTTSRVDVFIPRIDARDSKKETSSTKDAPDGDKPREQIASAKLGTPMGTVPSTGIPLMSPAYDPNAMYLDEYGRPQVGVSGFGQQPQSGVPCGPIQTTCFWVRPEYLYWTTEGEDVPPLVTSGGTAILGAPGTNVLFGGNEINDAWRSGLRLHGGFWLDPYQETGIEGNVFTLLEESTDFTQNGTVANPLGRPFFDIQIPGESVRLIPGAGFTGGTITIHASTELRGAELMVRRMIGPASHIPTALLVGYRFAQLDDDLRIDELRTNFPVSVTSFDSFASRNTFHGAELGLVTETRFWSRWTAEFLMKIALGNNHAKVQIDGATTTNLAVVPPVTTVGGLLAQASNIGTYDRNDFAVIPEFGANFGFNITDRLKATIGYTFIYWSQVARASEQIDRQVNLPPIPGPAVPQFTFVMTDFWAHGANLGLEYAY